MFTSTLLNEVLIAGVIWCNVFHPTCFSVKNATVYVVSDLYNLLV